MNNILPENPIGLYNCEASFSECCPRRADYGGNFSTAQSHFKGKGCVYRVGKKLKT